ncbi:hypothetical protein E3T61_13825 [Cryobacterium lactosi]|uniref:Uncharacterized protein n=1 Tax=Cryobacterium lactosi TaxID=1259202 RepID=A0A4R9BLE6_9MICO|nr:hypothetical protein [Cryobacterium lactosi]TFD86949.1 hypothetical protein E3T61_13825 [Cryobacterium lactosi]
MPVLEPEYSLRWPRELFKWEAERLLALGDEGLVMSAVGQLVNEAFEEDDAQDNFFRSMATVRNVFDTQSDVASRPRIEKWLAALFADEKIANQRGEPEYWAQRHGYSDPVTKEAGTSAVDSFSSFIEEMSYLGYFPRVLPKQCVDDRDWSGDAAGTKISRSVRLKITWPIPADEAASYPVEKLFSLIEYFHDQAYRPRLPGELHPFGGCGPHYSDWNKESGTAVYRWRVNELLEAHGLDVRLSKNPGEQGRLTSVLPQPLEKVVEKQLESRRDDPADEVAHALRDFRARSAGRPQKVAALGLLAGQLERRRDLLKSSLQRGDEASLFDIANNYAIRHRNDRQKSEYGDEYLNWIFNLYVSSIQLIDDLDHRQSARPHS